jgi:hypothetical protein
MQQQRANSTMNLSFPVLFFKENNREVVSPNNWHCSTWLTVSNVNPHGQELSLLFDISSDGSSRNPEIYEEDLVLTSATIRPRHHQERKRLQHPDVVVRLAQLAKILSRGHDLGTTSHKICHGLQELLQQFDPYPQDQQKVLHYFV